MDAKRVCTCLSWPWIDEWHFYLAMPQEVLVKKQKKALKGH